jgi:hypothetical protein
MVVFYDVGEILAKLMAPARAADITDTTARVTVE